MLDQESGIRDQESVFRARASETVLAFDFGAKRIGVAIGESLLGGARPLTTIAAEAKAQRFAAIDRLVAEWRPARLVVGRPAHVDRDAPHEFAARCERFARQLCARYRLPVELVDERYSSCVAAQRASAHPRSARTSLDADAAAVILQAWFDHRHDFTPSRP